MFKGYFFLFLLIGFVLEGISQDTQFSQFYANPLYLNPALTGKRRCPNIHLNYKNQWPAMGNSFVTYSTSYDQYFDKISGAAGVIAYMDDPANGSFRNLNVSGIYSYNTNLNRNISMNLALQSSYVQTSTNLSDLQFGDMIDPRYGFVNQTSESIPGQTKRNVDFSSGAVVYTDNFYLGIASHHLLQPNTGLYSINNLPRKYTIHSGYTYHLDPRYKRISDYEQSISVNILLQQQKNLRNINTGFYYTNIPLIIGLWHRRDINNADALIILAGIQKNFINFGYSYDITLSKIANLTGGSHELSLALQLKCKKKKKKFREIHCPTF